MENWICTNPHSF